MRKIFRIILRAVEVFFLFIFLLSALFHKLVSYGFEQGCGQLNIVMNARHVEEVLNDERVNDTIKQKLQLVEEIKKFAIDSLGLKASRNYTSVYDQHGKPVLWVVTASERYRLKPYEWWFPVIGNVGYKGFFNNEKGKKEEQQLIKEGFDVDYGPTSAWSTLGWFRDPILSNVLYRSEGQIAELFIHEMTHATLYVKSSVDFNENLASVIGEEGAVRFLEFRYGDSTQKVIDYLQRKEDYDLFSKQMLVGLKLLDSLYNSFRADMKEEEKSSSKTKMITRIVQSLDTVSFHNTSRYRNYFGAGQFPNNAFFLAFKRYDAEKNAMKEEMKIKFQDNFKNYLEYLEVKYR
ncbi:MAG: aminopeptidase [Bacteroidetes bacterium]|nr:aminopeptidase [Bacteroidota bacterium]